MLDRSALARQTDVAPVEILTALADSGQADVVTCARAVPCAQMPFRFASLR